MGMRPVFGSSGSSGSAPGIVTKSADGTTIVDKLLGVAYDTVKNVAENVEYVKHVSAHMEELYRLHGSIEAVDALVEKIVRLDYIHDNLPELLAGVETIEDMETRLNFLEGTRDETLAAKDLAQTKAVEATQKASDAATAAAASSGSAATAAAIAEAANSTLTQANQRVAQANATVATIAANFDTLAQATTAIATYAEGAGVNVNLDGANTGFYVKQSGVWVKKGGVTLPILDVRAPTLNTDERTTKVNDPTGQAAGIFGGVDTTDGSLKFTDEEGFVYSRIDPERGLYWDQFQFLNDGTGDGITIIDDEHWIYLKDGVSSQAASTTPAAAASRVWAGAVTDRSFEVAADISGNVSARVRLVVSTDAAFVSKEYTSPVYTPEESAKNSVDSWYHVKLKADGLIPNTLYYYALELDGVLNPATAQTVCTFPKAGVATAVRFVFGSCNNTRSGTQFTAMPAFDAISTENAAVMLHIGDMVYTDPKDTTPLYAREFTTRLFRDNPSVQRMLKNTPIAYMADDHDMTPNDGHWDMIASNGNPVKDTMAAVRQAYRETVPHYPFLQTELGVAPLSKAILTQVFDLAHVRFIMMDCRSQRRLAASGAPTCLGNGVSPPGSWDQLSAIKAQLVKAGQDGVARVFLVNPTAWGGTITSGTSGWLAQFPTEAADLCNFMRDTPGLPPITVLTGDIHYSGCDDGTNSDLSSGGGLQITQVVSSGLHQTATGDGSIPHTWNGVDTRVIDSKNYVVIDVAPDGHFTATIKGGTFDPVTHVAATFGAYSTTDL